MDGNLSGSGMRWRGRVVVVEGVGDRSRRGRQKTGMARVFHS